MNLYLAKKTGKPLSLRELEVLRLVVMGKGNMEISKTLSMSINTAKLDMRSILYKMSVDNRVQAAVKAVREGLV